MLLLLLEVNILSQHKRQIPYTNHHTAHSRYLVIRSSSGSVHHGARPRGFRVGPTISKHGAITTRPVALFHLPVRYFHHCDHTGPAHILLAPRTAFRRAEHREGSLSLSLCFPGHEISEPVPESVERVHTKNVPGPIKTGLWVDASSPRYGLPMKHVVLWL